MQSEEIFSKEIDVGYVGHNHDVDSAPDIFGSGVGRGHDAV